MTFLAAMRTGYYIIIIIMCTVTIDNQCEKVQYISVQTIAEN